MTGTRAMSGSAATRFRKRTIAAWLSSMPSSMLTSMICAPFSTCWRATGQRLLELAGQDQPRNAFEPVTLVRSPMLTNRIPERFRQLSRQQAAGFVGDGAGDHHGHVDAARFGDLGDRVQRRLGVQRVENGFDQQQIGAAVEQAVDLLAIGLAQIVEGDGAIAGVRYVGRDRGGAVGRAERAGDETRLAVLGADALGGGAREPWRRRG
jgi:hypothetical protein